MEDSIGLSLPTTRPKASALPVVILRVKTDFQPPWHVVRAKPRDLLKSTGPPAESTHSVREYRKGITFGPRFARFLRVGWVTRGERIGDRDSHSNGTDAVLGPSIETVSSAIDRCPTRLCSVQRLLVPRPRESVKRQPAR